MLTEVQKHEAKKFGWTEEEYARSVYAQQLNEPELVQAGERLARLMADFLDAALPGAVLSRVTLSAHGGLFVFSRSIEVRLSTLPFVKRIVGLAVLPFMQKTTSLLSSVQGRST